MAIGSDLGALLGGIAGAQSPSPWIFPVRSDTGLRISQGYGNPNSSYKAGKHTGIDIAGKQGSTVMAAFEGVVTTSGFDPKNYGNYVIVKHPNGLYTLYAHMYLRNVTVGTQVKAGQVLGQMGSTGNSTGTHLHFEVRNGAGQYANNIDPTPYLSQMTDIAAALRKQLGLPAQTEAGARQVGATGQSGAGSAGGGSHTVTYAGGGGSAGGGTVAEKPLTAQDFGFTTAFLNKYPEIKGLVDQAIKNQWSTAQFQGRIIDTNWYRQRSANQREYDKGALEDPKTWQDKVTQMLTDLTRLAKVMGVDSGNLQQAAQDAVRNGMSADDYIGFLANRAKYGTEQVDRSGLIQQQVIEYANAYGLSVSPDEQTRIIRDTLSRGSGWSEHLQSLEDTFRERAKVMYSAVAPQLDAGATVQDILDPYLSAASEMLGVSKATMTPSSSMWNRAIAGAQPMNLSEWQQVVRNDKQYRWDKGPQAMQWARSAGEELMKAFGAKT